MKKLLFPVIFIVMAHLAQAQVSDLGRIDFPTSAKSKAAQEHFIEGVLFLHSFEFDDAAEAFIEAQKVEPDFAMAYWGEAMTYNHPLWYQENLKKAREALNKLALTPEARQAKTPTAREKGYLSAVETLYGEGEKKARDLAYREAMRKLSAQFPNDLEAKAFYALSILGSSDRNREVDTYMRAAGVAEEIYEKNKNHPGALHYLIHSFDDPIHAPLGLRAARLYANVAPAAAHALHMPSHIFVAMGMWDEVAKMNKRSWQASLDRVERKGLTKADRSYHAIWWLQYAYLQQGRINDARKMLAIVEQDEMESHSRSTRYHLANMRAHDLIETEEWDAPAVSIEVKTGDLRIGADFADKFLMGFVAAKNGDLEAAKHKLAAMKARSSKDISALQTGETGVLQKMPKPEVLSKLPPQQKAAIVMQQELAAVIQFAEGHKEQAVETLVRATKIEENMSFMFGPPRIVKPSHELLGEMYLELGNYDDARKMFEAAMKRAPRRALSLKGLAKALEAAGEVARANETKEMLQEIRHHADTGTW